MKNVKLYENVAALSLFSLFLLCDKSQGFFLKSLFIYLKERAQAGGEAGERQTDSPLSREADTGPRPQDHDLSQSQTFGQLSHPGTPRGFLNLFI